MPGVTVTASTPTPTCDRSGHQRAGVSRSSSSRRARTGSRPRCGLQDLRRAKGSTLRTAETVTINVPAADSARVEETVTVSAASQQHRVERDGDRADDREQAHLGAAAQRAPGLHAAAAHRRHALHADDVRRDRLFGHARLGRERIALDSRQPHRQQRVPDRRRAQLGHRRRHGQLELRAAGGRHRGVQGVDVERRRARSAAPAAASST